MSKRLRSRSDIPERVFGRVFSHVDKDPLSGCWISRYSVGSHGYAQIGWNDGGKRFVTVAHRIAFFSTGQDLPDGMTVDHQCKNRRCVNPDHLRALSNFENARRTSGRDWPLGTCLHGHPNEYIQLVDGGRKLACIICKRDWRRNYYARVRAKRKEPVAI